MKKFLLIFCIIVALCIVAITALLLNRDEAPEISVAQQIEQYESVVDMVKNGSIKVKSNGLVVLPEELRYLSDTGECFIVEFRDNTAIYFYSFRGILESSKGYLYVTDKLCYKDYINTNKYVGTMDFVNLEKLDNNLYSCSTD